MSLGRAEAAEMDLFSWISNGVMWRRSAQVCHADSGIQLQPHSAEREGSEPRAGHQRRLFILPTPFVCGLVLLEHWYSGMTWPNFGSKIPIMEVIQVEC